MNEYLTIGALAKKGSVNVETIRYYQRRGLLQLPFKPRGGFRHYAPETVKRVRFIKRAQALGFTLEEIAGLLALEEKKGCLQTREIAARKLKLVEERIADLVTMKKALARLVHACDVSSAGASCPIICLLADD